MPRDTSLATLSVQDLRSELRRRQRSAGPLMRRRERLLKKLSAIDAQLSELGGSASTNHINGRTPGRRRRAVNETPLPEALRKVLQGKTMSVREVADAVRAAGYKTHSANFKIMVNMVLTKFPKLFKRVARGQYTAK